MNDGKILINMVVDIDENMIEDINDDFFKYSIYENIVKYTEEDIEENITQYKNLRKWSVEEIENRIFGGENLEFLRGFPNHSVDLVYLDPPFRTGRTHKITDKITGEIRRFSDTEYAFGTNTKEDYLKSMSIRLKEMHRILKPTGSIYLHCDWHASHYLKVEMDKIFGEDNFRNEIVWSYHTGGANERHFSRKHDIILFYSKTDDYRFDTKDIREPFREDKTNHFTDIDADGKRCRIREINGKKYYYYLEDGKTPSDVWEISSVNTSSKERQNYPTQKPEALLERIIKASTLKGDLILDPFCGCGTTLFVAEKLGCKYVGIDDSSSACMKSAFRLGVPPDNVIKLKNNFFEKNPKDVLLRALYEMNGYQLQEWVCTSLQYKNTGNPIAPSGPDGGEDGTREITSLYFEGLSSLQVKSGKSGKISDNDIKNLHSTLITENKKHGIIVGFDHSRNALEKTKKILKTSGHVIYIYKVEDIVDILSYDIKCREGLLTALLSGTYDTNHEHTIKVRPTKNLAVVI